MGEPNAHIYYNLLTFIKNLLNRGEDHSSEAEGYHSLRDAPHDKKMLIWDYTPPLFHYLSQPTCAGFPQHQMAHG